MVCAHTPARSGCPSGSRQSLSIHWDHSFLFLFLPLLSLQLKVTHQPQVCARLPDGWNDGVNLFFFVLHRQWRILVPACQVEALRIELRFLCLVKSPNSAVDLQELTDESGDGSAPLMQCWPFCDLFPYSNHLAFLLCKTDFGKPNLF